MGKYAQLVIGPAGAGKSTFCAAIQEYLSSLGRTAHVVNLDPAADAFKYSPTVDVRDIITSVDAMELLHLGPNGALVYCMEYVMDNMDWFTEQLGDYDEDYLIFDCPGQVELYSHYTVVKRFADTLRQSLGYAVVALFLLDGHFMEDATRFISGVLTCQAAMYRLELPHVNILTKMDLVTQARKISRSAMEDYLYPNVPLLLDELNGQMSDKYFALNEALGELISQDSMVSFVPFFLGDDDSMEEIMSFVDSATQFGEDAEPKEPVDYEND